MIIMNKGYIWDFLKVRGKIYYLYEERCVNLSGWLIQYG